MKESGQMKLFVKVTNGKRITLPKEFCARLEIDEGDYLRIELQDSVAVITPAL